MQHHHLHRVAVLAVALICSAAGCTTGRTATDNETGWVAVPPGSFDGYHSQTEVDANAYLLLGAVPFSEPTPALPPGLAAFLGRWEGYDLSLPVARDIKIALVVTSIDDSGGTAVMWAGTDLQVPTDFREIRFAVTNRDGYRIRWRADWQASESFRGEPHSGWYELALSGDGARPSGAALANPARTGSVLVGTANTPMGDREIELTRDQSFVTYRDYELYLSNLGITTHPYNDPRLLQYGDGWLVYLPPGYERDPERRWPLIYFLHGSGDTGREITVLAKASPFMYIRGGNSLDAIIVAPALREWQPPASFPMEYVRDALDRAMELYRIDPDRVSVTGLSMGGEATFRLALRYPDLVAAAAPLCFGDPALNLKLRFGGFEPFPKPYTRAIGVPFWIIQGADDPVIPPQAAVRTARRMEREGMNVRLSLLEDHDHDCWTATYSDPDFYRWLLSQ